MIISFIELFKIQILNIKIGIKEEKSVFHEYGVNYNESDYEEISVGFTAEPYGSGL